MEVVILIHNLILIPTFCSGAKVSTIIKLNIHCLLAFFFNANGFAVSFTGIKICLDSTLTLNTFIKKKTQLKLFSVGAVMEHV